MFMLLALALSAVSATPWPALRDGTRVDYAAPLLSQGGLLSSGCSGTGLLPGGAPDVHEVALEISRTSTKYRSELRAAYGNLVRWVATTRWSNQPWL